jgi:intracellular sulfur oxidation DsrE/DsrF family protein
MQRRAAFKSLLAALLAGAAAGEAQAGETRARRVVYHLDDADKVGFALANMKNHRAGGPEGLALSAVVLGPALALFHAADASEATKRGLAERLAAGDVFYACVNTLAAHGWTLGDLTPGFVLADKGGVVALADLQAQGFAYLRP